jgi:sensor c-di-GMP phosphodiesterase-like protein
MPHEAGLEIVAEGVASGVRADWRLKKGVQYAQGWYYAKAMPAAELAVWLSVVIALDATLTVCG